MNNDSQSNSSIPRRNSSTSRRNSIASRVLSLFKKDSKPLISPFDHIKLPGVLVNEGLSLLKVSHRSKKRILLSIDAPSLTFKWTAASIGSPKVYYFSGDDLRSILPQASARHFRDELNISKEFEPQWLSFSYYDDHKHKVKTLHVIADTEHDLKKVYNAMSNLQSLRQELAQKYLDLDEMDSTEREVFVSSDSSRAARHHLSFEDILKYTQRLNINVSERYLRGIFDSMELRVVEEGKVLEFDEFKRFIGVLKRREDMEGVWEEMTGLGSGPDTSVASQDQFSHFMTHIQNQPLSQDSLSRIYSKFSHNGSFSRHSLNQFLLSRYCQPLTSDPSPYDRPLNQYFISSSHNTYLTGRQVADESSAEGYVKALQKGCRCVEVDVWEADNLPVVCHGRLLTSSISFVHTLQAIKRHAFVASPLPLIISLEINCGAQAQLRVRESLLDVLGDLLVTEALAAMLLSPNELRHRILVKVKKTSPFTNLVVTESGSLTSVSTGTSTGTTDITTTTTTSASSTSSDGNSGFRSRRKRSTAIIDDLSDLAVYIKGVRFRNFSLPESKTFNHCFSLSEKTIDRMLKQPDQRQAIDKHNRKYLMRVYPYKMRLRSSNFNPITYWIHGVQMVATNWQTYDLGQQLNEALFDGGNKWGYVLKPNLIRSPLSKHTLKSSHHLEPSPFTFSITIISGHQLPKPSPGDDTNPYVKMEFFGTNNDPNSLKNQTCIVWENGFNPIWNQTFTGNFAATDFVFVKFTIFSHNVKLEDVVLGSFVASMSLLCKGYRYLPLNDIWGEKLIYLSLFIRNG